MRRPHQTRATGLCCLFLIPGRLFCQPQTTVSSSPFHQSCQTARVAADVTGSIYRQYCDALFPRPRFDPVSHNPVFSGPASSLPRASVGNVVAWVATSTRSRSKPLSAVLSGSFVVRLFNRGDPSDVASEREVEPPSRIARAHPSIRH